MRIRSHFEMSRTTLKILRNLASFHKICTKMAQKNLAVFDFDHTIADENTDIVVRSLVKNKIPTSLEKLYRTDNWTAYMQGIFELLHVHGFNITDIQRSVQAIPATKGIPELIKSLHEDLNYDIIIISDSNSFFIKTWLEENHLKHYIYEVFTNPARFERGLLKIEMYHLQSECKLSTKNLCKGRILNEFIQSQLNLGVTYNKIIFVGDGNNDFCPILRLGSNDLGCVREKYKCVDLINLTLNGKPIASTGETYKINSNILVWNTGYDILNKLNEPECQLDHNI